MQSPGYFLAMNADVPVPKATFPAGHKVAKPGEDGHKLVAVPPHVLEAMDTLKDKVQKYTVPPPLRCSSLYVLWKK